MLNSRFRINLVPKGAKVNIREDNGFKVFNLYLEEEIKEDQFNFLQGIIKSMPYIQKDLTQEQFDKDYYYSLKLEEGEIRFEINYGGKYIVDKKHPPTISIETTPYVPNEAFLSKIKEIVKKLVEETGYKLFFWNALDFLKVEGIYGRDK